MFEMPDHVLCGLCSHRVNHHDNVRGCGACDCLATPGEANQERPGHTPAPVHYDTPKRAWGQSVDLGFRLDKDAVEDIVRRLVTGQPGFSEGELGIQQAVNAIGRLQRAPESAADAALTVMCHYCGRTPGNPCHRGGKDVAPHPSRIDLMFKAKLGGWI